MKFSTVIFIGLSSLLALQACNKTCNKKCEGKKECHKGEHHEKMVNKDVTADAETTLRIEGMVCEMGCKGTIEKTLHKTPGIATAAIDFKNEKATITYDSKQISEQGIIDVIQGIGEHQYKATIWTDEQTEPAVNTTSTEETEV